MEYLTWFQGLKLKEAGQVESRLMRITDEDHFGNAKDLGDGLWEIKLTIRTNFFETKTKSATHLQKQWKKAMWKHLEKSLAHMLKPLVFKTSLTARI